MPRPKRPPNWIPTDQANLPEVRQATVEFAQFCNEGELDEGANLEASSRLLWQHWTDAAHLGFRVSLLVTLNFRGVEELKRVFAERCLAYWLAATLRTGVELYARCDQIENDEVYYTLADVLSSFKMIAVGRTTQTGEFRMLGLETQIARFSGFWNVLNQQKGWVMGPEFEKSFGGGRPQARLLNTMRDEGVVIKDEFAPIFRSLAI